MSTSSQICCATCNLRKGQALETGLWVRKQQRRRVSKSEPGAHTHDNNSDKDDFPTIVSLGQWCKPVTSYGLRSRRPTFGTITSKRKWQSEKVQTRNAIKSTQFFWVVSVVRKKVPESTASPASVVRKQWHRYAPHTYSHTLHRTMAPPTSGFDLRWCPGAIWGFSMSAHLWLLNESQRKLFLRLNPPFWVFREVPAIMTIDLCEISHAQADSFRSRSVKIIQIGFSKSKKKDK